jgi:peptidoglycan/LPS O-acetylase OafA/YrhL
MVVTTTGRPDGLGASLNFLRKRVLRIYPVYWVWTTVLLLLWGFKLADQAPSLTPSYVISSYFLWPALNDVGKWMPMINQGWSLSFELSFYLFFGASIALKTRRLTMLFLLAAFLALFALSKWLTCRLRSITWLRPPLNSSSCSVSPPARSMCV